MNNPPCPRPGPRTRRTFRPTGVDSFTAKSSHPFNESFFADLDARLAREERPPAILPLATPPRPSFPPATQA